MTQLNPKQIIDLSRNIENLVSEIKKSKKVPANKESGNKKEVEFKIPKNLENILDPLKNLKNVKNLGDDIKKLDLKGIKESVKNLDGKKITNLLKDPIINAIKNQDSVKFSDIKKGIDQINKSNDLDRNKKPLLEKENDKESPDEKKSFIKDVISSLNIEKILSKKTETEKKESVLNGSSLKKFLEKIENNTKQKTPEIPKTEGNKENGVKEVLSEVKNIFKGSLKENSDIKKTITEGILKNSKVKETLDKKGIKEIASVGKTVFDKIKGGIKKEKKREINDQVNEEPKSEISIKNKVDKIINNGILKKETTPLIKPLNKQTVPISNKDTLTEKKEEPKTPKTENSYNKKSLISLSPVSKNKPKPKEEVSEKKEEMESNKKEEFINKVTEKNSSNSSEKTITSNLKKEKEDDNKIDNKSLDEIKILLLRIASALESPLEVSTIDSPFRPDSRRV